MDDLSIGSHSTDSNTRNQDWSRRQILGAVGAAAGILATTRTVVHAEEPPSTPLTKTTIRVVAVSFVPPFHDHRKSGVNLQSLREVMVRVAREKPDFVCFPEACTCVGGGFEKGIEVAPERDPYLSEVGKIAREFQTAVIAPFLERDQDRVYNSVPIVDRQGRMILVYRKNYPTITELEAGITPGHEIPVAECDGVRVGAAVCFDANFDHVAAELERQRARLVFWPSMYWGGQLLQHWALRYGFAMAAAYSAESSIIDMNGRYLAKQGLDTLQVRQKHLPPWAAADIQINRELFHLDYNQIKLAAISEKYGVDVEIEVWEPEGYFLMSSKRSTLSVEAIAREFQLETNRDYLSRSVKLRDQYLKLHSK